MGYGVPREPGSPPEGSWARPTRRDTNRHPVVRRAYRRHPGRPFLDGCPSCHGGFASFRFTTSGRTPPSSQSKLACLENQPLRFRMSDMRTPLLLGQGICPIKVRKTGGDAPRSIGMIERNHDALPSGSTRLLPRVDPSTERALLPARIGISSARRLLLPPAGASIPAPRVRGDRLRPRIRPSIESPEPPGLPDRRRVDRDEKPTFQATGST